MDQISVFTENKKYSDEVINAVRYGYLYRKEAEKAEHHEGISVHYSLPDVSEILLWLGKNILSGLAYDAVKALAKNAYSKLLKSTNPISSKLNALLTEERELKQFYTYVTEFNQQCMSLTEKQFKYIREEIVADYYGKECGEIYNHENRLPTIQEYIRIDREANEYADRLLKPSV